jgi:hypothetical protein
MIKRLERLKNTVNKYMADIRPDRLTTCQSVQKLVVSRRPSVHMQGALKKPLSMNPCQYFKQKEWHIRNSKLNEIPHSSVYLPDASGIWRAVSMAYCQCQRVKVHMRFQVPMAVSMMFRVFWDVVACSHHQALHPRKLYKHQVKGQFVHVDGMRLCL